jgi:hypothetical protein
MVEALGPVKSPERLSLEKPFLVLAHAYQPHREPLLPSGGRLNVVPGINEEIYNQVYKPIFAEGESLPTGIVFSFYPGLRDWLKDAHPQEFQKIVEKINEIPNKEYHVLGDPYIHLILPLQPKEDQDMLIKIGKEAFKRDLGFEPKGIWLPETAVSRTTLEVVSDNGYEYIALRDNQIWQSNVNPIRVNTRNGKGINVIHFNSGLSGSLSFDDVVSLNADRFLENLSRLDSQTVVVGSDIELYGHHKKDRDKFLNYLEKPGTLEKHGFIPFDVKNALEETTGQITNINEASSWSCEHGLGRWTGECPCDNANDRTRSDKARFYQTLGEHGRELNSRLDVSDPNWRTIFADFFLENRKMMFNPGELPVIDDSDKLFWAKYSELVGKTSCGWFFGGESSPEREIPRVMIAEIEKLVPNFF